MPPVAADAGSAPDDPYPPMAWMLRYGREHGGAVRLEIYLTLPWLARGRETPAFAQSP
jgi:hypothetical protein